MFFFSILGAFARRLGGGGRFESLLNTALKLKIVPTAGPLTVRKVGVEGGVLADNGRNSLPCTVGTSRQRLSDQRVNCPLFVT